VSVMFFCSTCVGKLTNTDLKRSFEILNAILTVVFVLVRFRDVLKI